MAGNGMQSGLRSVQARWLGWLSVLVAALWLNLHVPQGGIVSDALLDKTNPYWQADQQVRQFNDLQRGDTLGVVVALPQGLTPASYQRICALTETFRQLLPAATVLSLCRNLNQYLAAGDSISSQPYLPDPAALDAAHISRQLPLMLQNPLIAGTLLGPVTVDHPGQLRYSQILLLLPDDYSEQQLLDEVAGLLEQRDIHALEWLLWKADVTPVAAFADVSLSGWALGRGLMHYALINDVLRYCTLGLLVATLAAWLALGSWRQALICSLMIFCSFVLVRAAIPLLNTIFAWFDWSLAGAPLQQRVYFLLVLSTLIVSGISLNIRALEAFNSGWLQAAASQPAQRARQAWQALRPQLPRFNLVLGIAALNFLGLSQIGIRGVLEVGVLSALGLAVQRLLVSQLLPLAVNTMRAWPAQTAATLACQRWLAALPQLSYRFWRTQRRPLMPVLAVLLLVLPAAGWVLLHDAQATAAERLIQVRERPIDYLPDTIIDRSRQLLNAPGAGGFAQLAFYLRPAPSTVTNADYPALADARFQQAVARFSAQLRQLPEVRTVVSVSDQLQLMRLADATAAPASTDTAARLIPDTAARVIPDTAARVISDTAAQYDRLQLLRWDLADERLAAHFWHDGGQVLWLGHPADDSVSLRTLAQQVMALAQQEPALQVLPFGALHSYHQTDLYISERKPLNALLGLPLVLALTAGWFFYSNRRLYRYQPQLPAFAAACAVCLPFVLAYALVVLVMAAFALPLDQATACATALAINAAIDFDLYLVEDFRQRFAETGSADQALQFAVAQRGQLTWLDAGLNALCFSFLLWSAFIPMQRLGVVMLVLLLVCALTALCVLPGVLLASCANRRTSE